MPANIARTLAACMLRPTSGGRSLTKRLGSAVHRSLLKHVGPKYRQESNNDIRILAGNAEPSAPTTTKRTREVSALLAVTSQA